MFRRPWSLTPNSYSFATHATFRKFSQSLNLQAFNGGHVCNWLSRRFPSPQVAARGAKTTTVKLEDLAQGVVPLDPLPLEDGTPTYPTVVLQARKNMRNFENCVLLTRVGGFYELYFEQAEEFGPLLNLKVALKKTNAGPVSMAGFPFFQLDRFLKILVQDLGRNVAVAEEFQNEPAEKVKSGGLMHDRRVARIITPGTLIDENFMDPYTNNYILAIHVEDVPSPITHSRLLNQNSDALDHAHTGPTSLGLAWLDLSTGSFFTQSITSSTLPSVLSRIMPSEIVLDKNLLATHSHGLFQILEEDRHVITYYPSTFHTRIENWAPMLETEITPDIAKEFTPEEISAGNFLLYYVKTRLPSSNMRLQPPLRYQAMEVMSIDKNSMRALEIKKTIRDGTTQGSLLHSIRRTVTRSGARLLEEWLTSPSTSLKVITSRLNLVSRMLGDTSLREKIVSHLKRCHDSQRLVQKFSLGRGDPEDLLDLANTVLATRELVAVLREKEFIGQSESSEADCLALIIARIQLDGPATLANRIKEAIDEDGILQRQRIDNDKAGAMIALAQGISASQGSPEDIAATPKNVRKKKPMSLKEHYADGGNGWIMKPSASASLGILHGNLAQLMVEKNALEEDLQKRLGVPTLTLRWTPGLGHICHVKGKDTRNLTDLKSVGSSRSTRSFHHPDWTHLGQNIDQAKLRIRAEEQHVFRKLREQVIFNLVKLRRNATVLDELDIACSFAKLAEEQGLVRPILNTSSVHKIIGGRHPTVQSGLRTQGRSFITNDCFVGDKERLWLITGPNMAGKSTFLRQNALITIMAQAGSYVPAEYAEIGIVDQIFSRVGSADNLYRNQSTFMVEMLETAAILRHATSQSLVIMDEIGRGTTPEDGVAVAFACIHHLYHSNQCRTLFATHFHSLADLSRGMSGVGYYCTDVIEDKKGGFTYIHRLRKGVNRESHALKVAMLAGVPEKAIDVARQTLNRGYPRKI